MLYEKLQIKSSLYDHLLHLFFGQISNEFFLVSVVSFFFILVSGYILLLVYFFSYAI